MSEYKWTFSFIDPGCSENLWNMLFDSREEAENAAKECNWNYYRVFKVKVTEVDHD